MFALLLEERFYSMYKYEYKRFVGKINQNTTARDHQHT